MVTRFWMHPRTAGAVSVATPAGVPWTEDRSVPGEARHQSPGVPGGPRSLTDAAAPRPMVVVAVSASPRPGGTVTAFPRESSHRARVRWPRPTSTRPRAPASASARAPGLTRTRTLRGWPRRPGGWAWEAQPWPRFRPWGGGAPVWRQRRADSTGDPRRTGWRPGTGTETGTGIISHPG